MVLITKNPKWIHSYLGKPHEGKYFSQLFCDYTRKHTGHFSYWSDEFHLLICLCWRQRSGGTGIISWFYYWAWEDSLWYQDDFGSTGEKETWF